MMYCTWCEAEGTIVRPRGANVVERICLQHLEELLSQQPEMEPATSRALEALEGEDWNE